MKTYDQHSLANKAQYYKYKMLAFPGAMIIINFLIKDWVFERFGFQIQYLSVVFLLLYFFILYIYRVSRTYVKPVDDCVLAPMSGVVKKIDRTPHGWIVTIKKPFFSSCEFMTATATDIPNELDIESEHVSWQIVDIHTGLCRSVFSRIFIDETIDYQGVLVGVVPGNAVCELFIPSSYTLTIDVDSDISTGLSIIAEKQTVADISDVHLPTEKDDTDE